MVQGSFDRLRQSSARDSASWLLSPKAIATERIVAHSLAMTGFSRECMSPRSLSICWRSSNVSLGRIARDNPQASASLSLVALRAIGNRRCQLRSVSRSPFLTSAMAQLLIKLAACSVSPAAIACWTASVHSSCEANQCDAPAMKARNFLARQFGFKPLTKICGHQSMIPVPASVLVEGD